MRFRLHDQEATSLSISDEIINDAFIELAQREQAMQEHSPYVVVEDRVDKREAGTGLVQTFLTLLAARLHYDLRKSLPAGKPAILFERVVTIALKNLFGNGRRFGWPYRDDGLETNFAEASRTLAVEMGEKLGKLYSASPSTKDQGLDVAAWHSFNDGYAHQVVLLCQCGIGADIEDKALSIEVWTDIISFSSLPLKGLAFPVNLGEWNEDKQFLQARRCGVLLGRARLVGLVKDGDLPQNLRQDIEQWCELAVNELPLSTT